jgi:hypothetical protein
MQYFHHVLIIYIQFHIEIFKFHINFWTNHMSNDI